MPCFLLATNRRHLSRDCNLFPLFGLGRFQYRVSYIVGSKPVAKRRSGHAVFTDGQDEIRGLVNEGVLVADLESWHPPVLHVRMVAVRNVNVLPSAQLTLIAVVEVFQP